MCSWALWDMFFFHSSLPILEHGNGFPIVPYREGHGQGLRSIAAVAEKYHGAISVKTQGAAFVLHVLLIIPRQEEEGDSRQKDKLV